LRLYEGLSLELNYNIMLSQRGMIILSHSEAEMEIAARIVNAMQIKRHRRRIVRPRRRRRVAPLLNFAESARYPDPWRHLAGPRRIARHDAVAWGYARAADRLGIDIIQNCEVLDFIIEGGRCRGVATSRGTIPRRARRRRRRRPFSTWRRRPGSCCRSTPTRCRPSFPSR